MDCVTELQTEKVGSLVNSIPFDLIVPVQLMSPATSSVYVGAVIPIPTFEVPPKKTLFEEFDQVANALLLAETAVFDDHTIAVFESQYDVLDPYTAIFEVIGILMFDNHDDVLDPNSATSLTIGVYVFDNQADVFEP